MHRVFAIELHIFQNKYWQKICVLRPSFFCEICALQLFCQKHGSIQKLSYTEMRVGSRKKKRQI